MCSFQYDTSSHWLISNAAVECCPGWDSHLGLRLATLFVGAPGRVQARGQRDSMAEQGPVL